MYRTITVSDDQGWFLDKGEVKKRSSEAGPPIRASEHVILIPVNAMWNRSNTKRYPNLYAVAALMLILGGLVGPLCSVELPGGCPMATNDAPDEGALHGEAMTSSTHGAMTHGAMTHDDGSVPSCHGRVETRSTPPSSRLAEDCCCALDQPVALTTTALIVSALPDQGPPQVSPLGARPATAPAATRSWIRQVSARGSGPPPDLLSLHSVLLI